MSTKPKRKLVLVIVEGKSDKKALKNSLSELYEQKDKDVELFFLLQKKNGKTTGGDITTELYYRDTNGKNYWVTKDNIVEAINERFLNDFFDTEKVFPKDIYEIIQIVDTDGAFIPEDSIVFNPNLTDEESPLYFNNRIECVNVDNIKYRNRTKSQNLIYLAGMSKIRVREELVPYSIYFFSSNLDHYLFNNPNLNKSSKVRKAKAFSNQYRGNPQGFVKFFSKGKENAKYEESWEKIQLGKCSLKQKTNIYIYLSELIGSENS